MMWIAVIFLVNSSSGNLVKIITFQTHLKKQIFLCICISFFCVVMSFVRDPLLLEVLGDSVRILILQDTKKYCQFFFHFYSLLNWVWNVYDIEVLFKYVTHGIQKPAAEESRSSHTQLQPLTLQWMVITVKLFRNNFSPEQLEEGAARTCK